MAFTAVFEQEASWGEVARAKVVGRAEVVPAVDVRPPGTTQEQVNQTNKRLIDESKPIAAVVALRAAGYAVLEGAATYIVENPIRAGLRRDASSWRWSALDERMFAR